MNRTAITFLSLFAVAIGAFAFQSYSKQGGKEPWTKDQLMQPSELARTLDEQPEEKWPLILAVNPDGMHGLPYEAGIKGAKWFGPAEEKESLDKLRSYLEKVDKDKEIVLYCGCCPFNVCPNIRPAFDLLNKMGFKDHKLLNIPKNIKENWMDKGYPMNK